MVMKMLNEYLLAARQIPALTIDIIQRLVEILQVHSIFLSFSLFAEGFFFPLGSYSIPGRASWCWELVQCK
jgi:hypothetical protein